MFDLPEANPLNKADSPYQSSIVNSSTARGGCLGALPARMVIELTLCRQATAVAVGLLVSVVVLSFPEQFLTLVLPDL